MNIDTQYRTLFNNDDLSFGGVTRGQVRGARLRGRRGVAAKGKSQRLKLIWPIWSDQSCRPFVIGYGLRRDRENRRFGRLRDGAIGDRGRGPVRESAGQRPRPCLGRPCRRRAGLPRQ